MRPNSNILNTVLESFSSVDIDGIEMVEAHTFPFSPNLDGAEEYASRPVKPDTVIVRFESEAERPEHVETFYFRREDLFAGEVVGDVVLIAEGLSGGPSSLTFFVDEKVVSLV